MVVGLKDVAAQAGVSMSTVSRVFSSPHLISDETVRRVRMVADELDYVPNPYARALITGTSRNVGLIVPDIANPFASTLLKAAQRYARSLGYAILVGDTDEDPNLERELASQLFYHSYGLILCAPRMVSKHITDLANKSRVVLINRVVGGLPSVLIDSAPGTRATVDHLAELGHRRVAYLPGPARSWSNRERLRAVTKQSEVRRIKLVVLANTDARHEDGFAAAESVQKAKVTAVIAFDDLLAFGLIEGLHERGLTVPGDVSVTGHDDVVAFGATPRLTTVTGASDAAARTALDILMTESARPVAASRAESVRLPTELVIRQSTSEASR